MQHLIRVQLLADGVGGRHRTWAGSAWVDPDNRSRPVQLDVDRDFVRGLGISHPLTIYLTPRASTTDIGPGPVRDAGPDPAGT